MVAYGIGIILMIKLLKAEFPGVTHPWYADGAGALGTFANVELYFNSLRIFVPGRVYYPETSKLVLVVHQDSLKSGKGFGLSHRFKVCTGTF